MALFNVSVWQRSRFTLQWFIINLVGSLACLTAVALAQFELSEGVSGSASIPDVALTCLGNLGVFMTAFIRGRLDMENGARDVLATNRGPKLNAINGCGLATRPPNDLRDIDVVILSQYNERPHSSLTQFMQYISHSHHLESILLQVRPFTAPVTAEICECGDCRCVVFGATEEIMMMLAHRLPGTLKRLPESQCLLPSFSCLRNGCHGCNQGLSCVEDLPDVEAAGESSPAAVCEALNQTLIEEEESSGIFIPVHPGNADRWTKFMIKFLKSKEKEAKGIKVVASDALRNYTTHSSQEELGLSFRTITGSIVVSEIYESASLILPRVAEVIVNMGLTGWLRMDGFSSSLVARRAIRDYVVDSAGTGFGAKAFLTEAAVFCSAEGTNVCQVLCFRDSILSARGVSYIVGNVNLICSITWSVLIAREGNWTPSKPLSTPRLAVIIGAVGYALVMDCCEVYCGKVWALSWARFEERAKSQARHQAEDQARSRALHGPRHRPSGRGLSEAETRALGLSQDQARDQAKALQQAQARARDQARDQAKALQQVQAPARAQAPALQQTRAQAPALQQTRAQAPALQQTRALARALVQAQARDGGLVGLVAVVILEVVCIASLVVRLSMNKRLGRWVYSGMQVLVWVKWGVGSFLLGDKATEDEDGSPYLFWTRNRGKWVYCSAFLLNAILTGVRRY